MSSFSFKITIKILEHNNMKPSYLIHVLANKKPALYKYTGVYFFGLTKSYSSIT